MSTIAAMLFYLTRKLTSSIDVYSLMLVFRWCISLSMFFSSCKVRYFHYSFEISLVSIIRKNFIFKGLK